LLNDKELTVYLSNKEFTPERLFTKIDEDGKILFLFGLRKFVE
jgi:hypothetical protein